MTAPPNLTRALDRWRVGRKLGRTVYCCDTLVGMMDAPELAQEIVDVMNHAEREPCTNPDCPIDCPASHCYPLPEAYESAAAEPEAPTHGAVCRFFYGDDGGFCFSSDDVVGERCRWHR